MKKMPPREKVYEAWTAIADRRVDLHPDFATVRSSDGTKTYTVRFKDNTYTSDDNATFWQGYPGYPVIAVLMLQGRLPLDSRQAELWKDLNWTELNKKHRNRYAEAVSEIEKERAIDAAKASEAVDKVMAALKALPVEIRRKV